MGKLQSVKSTAYPNGDKITYDLGMPKPKPLYVDINKLVRDELNKVKNLKKYLP